MARAIPITADEMEALSKRAGAAEQPGLAAILMAVAGCISSGTEDELIRCTTAYSEMILRAIKEGKR